MSQVTSTNSLFDEEYDFNNDLSGWNTSSVTDMSSMFYSAYNFNGAVSGFDTSSVTDMSSMFTKAYIFNKRRMDKRHMDVATLLERVWCKERHMDVATLREHAPGRCTQCRPLDHLE